MSRSSGYPPPLIQSVNTEQQPAPDTPEFDAWLLKRAEERAARYLADDNSLGDDERGLLAGGYDRLLMSEEELAKEEETMEQALKQERRKHLKSVDSK